MKNVKLAYILTALSELYWPSVPALFFYLRYFSFAEIATLWAIQMAASNLLEIPTGALADVVGRKKTIVWSFMIGAIVLFLFPFTTSLWVFVVLEILKGLANALYSGSMEALVFDDLKERGKERQYPTVAAHIETINWVSWAISSVGGGYLYYLQYQSPWLIQGIMFVVAAILATKLIEPRLDSIKVSIKGAWKQSWRGFQELFKNARTSRITLQLVMIGGGYIIASNILGASQAREYGMGATGTGWIFGVGCILSVLAARVYPRLRNWVGERKLVVITAGMMLTSFLVARYVGVWAGVGLILLRIASSSTFRNTRTVIVNQWISSANRATALSTLSLLTQTPYMFLAPLFGSMIDRTSPNQFAWMLGVGIVVVLAITEGLNLTMSIIKRS